MKIYLAGPMTGYPELNFPAFQAEAKRLRSLGYEVCNPAELNSCSSDWHSCMRVDIAHLVSCEAIAFLPGWEASRGAKLELDIARGLDMKVFAVNIDGPLKFLVNLADQTTSAATIEAAALDNYPVVT